MTDFEKAAANRLPGLERRKLIVVTGKGGVGKSMLTVALGRILAARGRRVLLLEVDPRENLHPMLGTPPSGGSVLAAHETLFLQNLKPKEVADWVVRKQVKIEMVAQKVLESPVYHRFVEGAPGLREMAIIGHVLRLLRGEERRAPRVDTVILDAPATGHGVYLLTSARLYAETIGHGPFADLAREIADFAGDPEKTSVVIATLAEEMPVQEALELREKLLAKLGSEPELLVVNGIYPALPPDGGADSDPLTSLWRRRRAVNDRELKRLAEHWPGPWLELPLVPEDPGPEMIEKLADALVRADGGEA
ncbi:MAG: ArsA-related P-loop ATPase [Acidobacteriota bacterium]